MTLRLERKYHVSSLGSGGKAAGSRARGLALGIPTSQMLEMDTQAQTTSRKALRWSIGISVLFHLVLFLITFPSFRSNAMELPSTRRAYVLQPVRFSPPKPQEQRAIPKRKAKKVPFPDPTPDLPEPIETEEFEVPEVELSTAEIGDLTYVPDAPPGIGMPAAMEVGGNILPPEKLVAPQPGYTEEARQARIQGVVILQAIIDEDGTVRNVRTLKGLPNGLTESAVATVKSWRFRPATLEGKPVPVYFNFTINFSLQ